MGIDADRVSRQTEQLRSTDVLVVPESPSRQWGMLLGCVVFTVLSVGLLALANQSDSSLQFMVSGIAGVVFFGRNPRRGEEDPPSQPAGRHSRRAASGTALRPVLCCQRVRALDGRRRVLRGADQFRRRPQGAVLQQAYRYYGGSRASDGWNGPGR